MSEQKSNQTLDLSKEKSKATNSGYELPKEGWGFVPWAFAIAIVILPPIIWLLPEIPFDWAPRKDNLIKYSIGIVVIALGLRINTWIKNKSETGWESSIGQNKASSGGGAKVQNDFSKGVEQSKPLTKTYSENSSKFKPKEVGKYRHESLIKDDNIPGGTSKNWGGSNGSANGNNSSRFALKKPTSQR
ncbi:MAG UNVERIFIED_CONTAM: hypothetical protein LVQ98_02785 [Rickettsiaceae bacterium]|jgi:hypothetical protein